MVVATNFSRSIEVEIIQDSKALHRLCGQGGDKTRRGRINALLFIFRTSRNDKLTESVSAEMIP